MGLRRRRDIDCFPVPPPEPVPYPMDAHHPPADFEDGPIPPTQAQPQEPPPPAPQPWRFRDLEGRVAELEQLVAELVKATHDHCISCGAMTPEYGRTECGRAECRQSAT